MSDMPTARQMIMISIALMPKKYVQMNAAAIIMIYSALFVFRTFLARLITASNMTAATPDLITVAPA